MVQKKLFGGARAAVPVAAGLSFSGGKNPFFTGTRGAYGRQGRGGKLDTLCNPSFQLILNGQAPSRYSDFYRIYIKIMALARLKRGLQNEEKTFPPPLPEIVSEASSGNGDFRPRA